MIEITANYVFVWLKYDIKKESHGKSSFYNIGFLTIRFTVIVYMKGRYAYQNV